MTRSPETEIAYLEAGLRHMRVALKAHPSIDDPIEALCLWHESQDKVLQPATVRLYRMQVASVIRSLGCGHDSMEIEAAVGRADAALRKRSGVPEELRTASLKVKDATEAEASKLFRHLARRAQGCSNLDLIPLLALFLFLVPRLGLRPIEWIDARVEGETLIVRTAKAGNGRAGAAERRIDLAGFKPILREAVRAFASAVPASVARYRGFKPWRNALSEALARACQLCGMRRLSLYAFRHTAIATWTKAGLSRAAIAALAGHAALDTARRHYAGAGSGWEPRDGLAAPDPERVSALETAAFPAATAETGVEPDLDLEQYVMPMPSRPTGVPDPAAVAAAAVVQAKRAAFEAAIDAFAGRHASSKPSDPPEVEGPGPARPR